MPWEVFIYFQFDFGVRINSARGFQSYDDKFMGIILLVGFYGNNGISTVFTL